MKTTYFEGEQPVNVKAYYKNELADMYNVCAKTFASWIHIYLEELSAFGYKKTTKRLRPEVVRFIFERLG